MVPAYLVSTCDLSYSMQGWDQDQDQDQDRRVGGFFFSAAFVAALGRPNWYKHRRLAATWPKRVHVHLANPQLRCANRNRQDNRLLGCERALFSHLLCVLSVSVSVLCNLGISSSFSSCLRVSLSFSVACPAIHFFFLLISFKRRHPPVRNVWCC